MELRDAIARVCSRRDLSADEMADTIGRIMDGQSTPAQIAALLVGLRQKGETVAEVVGAARAMRERAAKVAVSDGGYPLVDTCGTGGDGARTVNVSTIAALVVAACGVPVAKHGNRSVSSQSGSADVLEALGVDVAAPPATVEKCLREVGIGFLFAPAYHGATRHVAPVRREIGVRTIFNLLGPLTNPAGARHQVVGVYDLAWLAPVAEALGALGGLRAMVLHGAGGLDEFAPHGPTDVAELRGGEVIRYQLQPRDFAVAEGELAELCGGDAARNAQIVRAVLDGAPGAVRSVVVMTAAAALYVAGAAGLRDGARRAEQAIDDGSARRVLARLVAATKPAEAAGSILDAIVAAKRRAHQRRSGEADQRRRVALEARTRPAPPPFAPSLRPAEGERGPRVIAEFKRRSPSAGAICPHARVDDVARQYVAAGAAALSILTDEEFFGGSLDDLEAARVAVAVPLLRKDFALYAEDLVDAAWAGASAALLIVRLLDDATLRGLLAVAGALGIETLVEVHDAAELDRALAAGAPVVGVNHRNLDTLAMDLALSARLADRFPVGVTRVAESGLRSGDDLRAMHDRGYHAVLVGEALLRAESPGDALRALRGAAS